MLLVPEGVKVAVGFGLTVITTEDDEVVPQASLTVTVYVVEEEGVTITD